MDIPASSGLVVRRAAAQDAASLARLFSLFDDENVSAAQVIARLEAVQEMEIALLAETGPTPGSQPPAAEGGAAPGSNTMSGPSAAPGPSAAIGPSAASIVGFACLKITPSLASAAPHAEITEFYTDKERQDGSAERLLLRAVEALARQRGASHLLIFTGLKNNAAQALYHSAGYQDYALALRKRLRPD